MGGFLVLASIAWLACLAPAQQTPSLAKTAGDGQAGDAALSEFFQAKVKAEWEALKNKDKKAYGDLLADDYQGVEVDGRGERNKIQAINELTGQNVFSYTLWGFKVISLGADSAFVIYEVTMQFPPSAQIRYSRVYVGELWVSRVPEEGAGPAAWPANTAPRLTSNRPHGDLQSC